MAVDSLFIASLPIQAGFLSN